MNNLTREDFIKLDTLDPIKKAREEFSLPKDVIYFDGNYAKGDSSICSTLGLSIKEEKLHVFSIYPNPSNNLININLDKGQLNAIEIYNLTGTLIFKTNLNSNNFKLNIDQYPSGTYILRIFDQNYDVTISKIVKE